VAAELEKGESLANNLKVYREMEKRPGQSKERPSCSAGGTQERPTTK